MNGVHTAASAPITSRRAAGSAKRREMPVRRMVEDYALRCGGGGFTDDELFTAFPGEKINTLRPRRSDLTDENRILDSGRTLPNAEGQDCVVWVHRDFVPGAPTIIEGGQRRAKLLKAEKQERAAVLTLLRQHHRASTSQFLRDKITEIGQQIAAGSHRL